MVEVEVGKSFELHLRSCLVLVTSVHIFAIQRWPSAILDAGCKRQASDVSLTMQRSIRIAGTVQFVVGRKCLAVSETADSMNLRVGLGERLVDVATMLGHGDRFEIVGQQMQRAAHRSPVQGAPVR